MSQHRRDPKQLLLGVPNWLLRFILINFLLLTLCGLALIWIESGAEQAIATGSAVLPAPLVLPFLISALMEFRDEDAKKMVECSVKLVLLTLVGFTLRDISIYVDAPNAQAGPGLLLAGFIAVISWTLVAEAYVARIYGYKRLADEAEAEIG